MSETSRRRILAVDYGERRTGLAATDWTGTLVVPLPRVEASDVEACARSVATVARERESECIVIGLPLRADGGEGERAARTRRFASALAAQITVPIEFVDETHSTDEAHERLKQFGLRAARRKQAADSVAAIVILERYLRRA
ncbi:MAG: Holliday junction resolvase RuvX [Planctomycetota bacterium]